MRQLAYVAFGICFGWTLSRSGATDYDFIQQMFLFESFQLYGIIGVAIVIAAPGIYLLKRYGKTLFGAPLIVKPKPAHRGNLIGGVFFGIGWALTGMCPGPVLVNIGEGKLYAFGALAGVLVGAGLFGVLQPKLAGSLGMKPAVAPPLPGALMDSPPAA